MPSPNLDTLFPAILPEVGECPLDMVRLALLRAAGTFCRNSTAWRVLLDPVPLIEGVAYYPLTLPVGTQLVMICNIYTPNGELTGRSLDDLRLDLPTWQTETGAPRYFNSADFSSLTLYPTPVAVPTGYAVTPRVALAPGFSAADLPVLLTGRYAEALIAGALAHLFAMAGRPWAAPERVPGLEAEFVRLTAAARIETEHERVRGSLTAKPRRFGA